MRDPGGPKSKSIGSILALGVAALRQSEKTRLRHRRRGAEVEAVTDLAMRRTFLRGMWHDPALLALGEALIADHPDEVVGLALVETGALRFPAGPDAVALANAG